MGFLYRSGSNWAASIWLMSSRRLQYVDREKRVACSHKGVCLQCAPGSLSPLTLFSHGKVWGLWAAALTLERGRGAAHQPGQMLRFILQHTRACHCAAPKGTNTHTFRQCERLPLQHHVVCLHVCGIVSHTTKCRQQEDHLMYSTVSVGAQGIPDKHFFKPTTSFDRT